MTTINGNHGAHASSSQFDTHSVIPLWLDGEQVTTSSTYERHSPIDGKLLWKTATAQESDAQAAVAAAEKAFPSWSKTKPAVRQDIFLRAAAEFERRMDEQAHYEQVETGTSPAYFNFDFADGLSNIKQAAGLLATALTGSVPTPKDDGRAAMILREPYGVILAIAPWNAQSILGMRSFLAPIAMGNTVVLKGPEASPAAFWLLADVFHKAGLPAGVLNTVIVRPEDAPAVVTSLIAHPAVKKVNFTGSTAVGAIVAETAGRHLKPVLMELGGKAPAIVCDDADVSVAAPACALGAFLHAGQVCMSTERIIVHAGVLGMFRAALKGAIDGIFTAHADLHLVSGAPVLKNKRLVEDALGKGATLAYGNVKYDAHVEAGMRPLVVEGVKPGMDLFHTESFGPTVSLIVVESDDEAVALANDTEYGLTASVFTSDLARGIRIAKRIESGAVHINNMSVHDEAELPHGGAKKSGWGRFGGLEGMREWVRTKTITFFE